MRKHTNQEIIEAYKETGSVWAAAKRLGMCGQSVWERLKRLGHPLSIRMWSDEEIAALRSLVNDHTLTECAIQLGRSYGSVASMVSSLQIGVRYGNKIKIKREKPKPLGADTISLYYSELQKWDGSARQFCRSKGIRLDRFVIELQRYLPGAWERYAAEHSVLTMKPCPQCSKEFLPMTQKQVTCSRTCATAYRVDRDYFGGKRSTAVGIHGGVCQLCGKTPSTPLSAHHMFGRENDPEHSALIALCAGCHHVVGCLAGSEMCNKKEFWEFLIQLALMRHNGPSNPIGFYTYVDIEEMTEEDLEMAMEAIDKREGRCA